MKSKLLLILVLGMFSPQGYPEKSFAKIFTRGMVGSFGVVSATPSVPLEGKDFVIRNQSDSSDVYFKGNIFSSKAYKFKRFGSIDMLPSDPSGSLDEFSFLKEVYHE